MLDAVSANLAVLKSPTCMAAKKKGKLLELAAGGNVTDSDFRLLSRQCDEETAAAEKELAELENQQNSNEDFRKNIESIRATLRMHSETFISPSQKSSPGGTSAGAEILWGLFPVYLKSIPYFRSFASMAAAAFLPAPIARMTVAAPVTASPPAKTFSRVDISFSSTIMPPFLLVSRPGVVERISGFGEVPSDMVTHDRYFLERVVTGIAELSRGTLACYEANYSRYLALKAQQAEMAEASERKRQAVLRREYQWVIRGCQARTTKSKERLDRYETLKNRQGPQYDESVQLAAMNLASTRAKTTREASNSSAITSLAPSSSRALISVLNRVRATM